MDIENIEIDQMRTSEITRLIKRCHEELHKRGF